MKNTEKAYLAFAEVFGRLVGLYIIWAVILSLICWIFNIDFSWAYPLVGILVRAAVRLIVKDL